MERRNHEAELAIIDAEFPSPQERAGKVHAILATTITKNELSDWDILCYCVGMIGWLSEVIPFIEADAKSLNRLLYTAHYYDRESDPLKSSRAGTLKQVGVTDINKSAGDTEDNRLDVEGSELKFGDNNS
jgi:hypothetical protein